MEGEIARLKWQLDRLTRRIFGPGKSEKLDRMQLPLQMKELEEAVATEVPKQTISYERTAPSPEKRPAPAELLAKLPVKETVVIEPDEVKADPEGFERIGEERTFEVEITKPELFKREIIRPKYRARADRARPPVVAKAPARAVPGGYASARLLA